MLLLTQKEVEYLTEYKRPADQIRWLKANNIRYLVGSNGKPKVSRAVVEAALGNAVAGDGIVLDFGKLSEKQNGKAAQA